MKSLEGKVAVVTGAGQGIGQGIALALAKEGAAVSLIGRTEATLRDTEAQIGEAGGTAHSIRCDVAAADDIADAIAATVDRLGGIDILINNAHDMRFGTLLDSTDADFTASFSSGPMAVFRLMRACHPHMKARGGGAIVNVASPLVTQWNTAGFGIYTADKESIRALTRSAANEWGADGIRVNTIAPLAMNPRVSEDARKNPDRFAETQKTIPLGRVGDPESDIGAAVVFLVGPAARYLTGATVPLDGGRSNFG